MSDEPESTALVSRIYDGSAIERGAERGAQHGSLRPAVLAGARRQIQRWDAIERAKRQSVRPERVGDRWRVIVTYMIGDERKRHESMAVFKTADEACDRGAHFIATVCAKEIRV